MIDPAFKRSELQAMPDDELAREARACRRLMRQAADDWWNGKWWDLIRDECDRRNRKDIAVMADAQEVAEHRAAREANRAPFIP